MLTRLVLSDPTGSLGVERFALILEEARVDIDEDWKDCMVDLHCCICVLAGER